MRIEAKTGNGPYDEYSVDMGDGRKAFLVVRRGSHPLRVSAGSATGATVVTSGDQTAAVDEAGRWLLTEIESGRA